MKKMISALITAILLCTASMSMAKDCMWPYVGAIGGASIASPDDRLNLATGYMVGGVVGVEFCNARLEAEVAYHSNNIDYVNSVRTGGDISVRSYLVNGFYEFDVSSKKWRPYVGGGAGLATADISPLVVGGVQVNAGASDTRFAYQGIGGLAFYLTK